MNNGNRISAVEKYIRPTAAAVALTLGVSACSGSTPDFNYDVASADVNDSTDTTARGTTSTERATTTIDGLNDDQSAAAQELIDAGLNPEAVTDFMENTMATPLITASDCDVMVENAFVGGRTEAIDKGYLFEDANGDIRVDTNISNTAGRALISNGGVQMFTDSNAAPFPTGEAITSRTDVSEFYGDAEMATERFQRAMDVAFMRLCTDDVELAGAMVMTANATIGNTTVRLGQLDDGRLSQYVIDGEITNEKMDAMIALALDAYQTRGSELGADAVENYDIAQEAYNNQLLDAARVATLLDRLTGAVNTGDIQVDASTVVSPGHDSEEFAQLKYSDQPVDSTEKEEVGGEYLMLSGEGISFFGEYKGGCLSVGGLVLNLLDGRYGYTVVTTSPEGCEPITVITTTSTIPTTGTTVQGPTTTVPDGRKGTPATTAAAADVTSTTAAPTAIDTDEPIAPTSIADTIPAGREDEVVTVDTTAPTIEHDPELAPIPSIDNPVTTDGVAGTTPANDGENTGDSGSSTAQPANTEITVPNR